MKRLFICIVLMGFQQYASASNVTLTENFIPNFKHHNTNPETDFVVSGQKSLFLVLPSLCDENCQNYVYMIKNLTYGFSVVNLVSKPADNQFIEGVNNLHTRYDIIKMFNINQLPALIVHDGKFFKGTYEGFLSYERIRRFNSEIIPEHTKLGYKYSIFESLNAKYLLDFKTGVLVFESSECSFSEKQRAETKKLALLGIPLLIVAYNDVSTIREIYKGFPNVRILEGASYPELANDLHVKVTPTSMVLVNGIVRERIDGYETGLLLDSSTSELGL